MLVLCIVMCVGCDDSPGGLQWTVPWYDVQATPTHGQGHYYHFRSDESCEISYYTIGTALLLYVAALCCRVSDVSTMTWQK